MVPRQSAESIVDVKPGTDDVHGTGDPLDPIGSGTTIMQTGGVSEGSTVTLTPNDRVVVE